MSKHPIIKFDPTVPAKFADWFGPPAVLTAEGLQAHDKVLCGLFDAVRPRDFIECTLIYDWAYNFHRLLELRRLRDKVIRHANNERLEPMERDLVREADAEKEDIRKRFDLWKSYLDRSGAHARQPLTQRAIELEKLQASINKQLEEVEAKTNKRLAELRKAKEVPIDEAATFDLWIDKVERIEEELAVAQQNICIAQKLLDEHRTGLGQCLRQVSDEIVDVEFADESAPACEEVVGRAQSACATEVGKPSAAPITVSSVAELPSPVPACEEAVGRAQSACGAEIRKVSTEPITVSSVAELPLPAPSQTSGSTPIRPDGPQKSALPADGEPAE